MSANQPAQIITPDELKPALAAATRLLSELNAILLGHSDLHKMVLIGILSKGHILLEGVPGVGKTSLIKALGSLMNLKFNRVQFTPDLMPQDILGSHILQQHPDGRRQMTFEPGAVFTNILLADEINRASPKTQSALLEAMQERSVTLLGETRKLPEPFFVLASQNPIELEGTYPLPEAQLDRFMFKLLVSGVDVEVMDLIISSRRRGEMPLPDWNIGADDLKSLFGVMERIYLPKTISRYISRLVAATHPGGPGAPQVVTDYIAYGASPRAAIAIAESSRAAALLAGRPTVGFEDVRAVTAAVLNHRLILNYKARFDRVTADSIIAALLSSVAESEIDLPADISITEPANA
jgi:MoxR-like ATPase